MKKMTCVVLAAVGMLVLPNHLMAQTNVSLSTGASLKIYTAPEDKANGGAVVIYPGGGYSYVASDYEGADWAPMLNELGFTAAVLTYRMPNGAANIPLNDGRAALRHLRQNAEELHLKTDRIGVMGFSAGGHLASTIATHLTGSDRPAFQILFYPVITMDASFTHAGSRQNLLGSNPSDKMVKLYSNELHVTAETPMAYLCWADNDGTVPPRNSIEYAEALRQAGVSVHTKNFPTGGHGFGFRTTYEYHDEMVADLTAWLQTLVGVFTNIHETNQPPTTHSLDAPIYTLSGQRVTHPHHGLYITNKRKMLVR